ncbi:MAG: carboxymuconolactone decarboxylase family protein [Burkholderiales bacterium]|nr:MAG: carboxymuconolactone decarboxylase family protein [Burkholderiales bacterium]
MTQRLPFGTIEPATLARIRELWKRDPVNLYRVLGNQPALVAGWTEFAAVIRYGCELPRDFRELLILRNAVLQRSEYELAHHSGMARAAGVGEARIAAVADWRGSELFDAREQAALAVCDEVTEGRLSEATFAAARELFSNAELLEIVVTVGFYCMVGRVLQAFQVELEPEFRTGDAGPLP